MFDQNDRLSGRTNRFVIAPEVRDFSPIST
jgi:hypothetical protein